MNGFKNLQTVTYTCIWQWKLIKNNRSAERVGGVRSLLCIPENVAVYIVRGSRTVLVLHTARHTQGGEMGSERVLGDFISLDSNFVGKRGSIKYWDDDEVTSTSTQ